MPSGPSKGLWRSTGLEGEVGEALAAGLRSPRTGTEYMVLMLLLKRSVASMNKLSMGVFCERRSFTCMDRVVRAACTRYQPQDPRHPDTLKYSTVDRWPGRG